VNNIPEIHFTAEQDDGGQWIGTLTIHLGDTKSVFHGPLKPDSCSLDIQYDIEQHHPVYGAGYAEALLAQRGGSHFTIKLDFLRADRPVEAP
jgi:hypothetical protein